jgi:hypothetical protein
LDSKHELSVKGTDPRNDFVALNDIKDSALLLSNGNAFLCEEVFLKKFGKKMGADIERVKAYIASLKKQFPGQFARHVDTDEMVEEIRGIARRLQNPDKEITDKCASGQVGAELEKRVRALMHAVKTVQTQVEKTAPAHTGKDSSMDFFDPLKHSAHALGGIFGFLMKTLLVACLLCVLAFAYLFFTMESEGPFLREITQNEALIQYQEEILAQVESDIEGIAQKIAAIESYSQARQDKIELIELRVKGHELEQERQALDFEIAKNRKIIEENRKKLEQIRNKPFIKRLLRL